MTWRLRSVRKRILLLALVPLLSLFGLYVFTTSITARNAINLARANTLKNATGQPTGIETVRTHLHRLGYVCKRPTWSLKRKSTEQAGWVKNA